MDKDMSRMMVERAGRTLYRIKAATRKAIPYGPGKVKLTPSEMRARMQKLGPNQFQELMQYLGPEQAIQLLIGMRPKRPRELDEFIQEEVA